jgi:hypothetical protein
MIVFGNTFSLLWQVGNHSTNVIAMQTDWVSDWVVGPLHASSSSSF